MIKACNGIQSFVARFVGIFSDLSRISIEKKVQENHQQSKDIRSSTSKTSQDASGKKSVKFEVKRYFPTAKGVLSELNFE